MHANNHKYKNVTNLHKVSTLDVLDSTQLWETFYCKIVKVSKQFNLSYLKPGFIMDLWISKWK